VPFIIGQLYSNEALKIMQGDIQMETVLEEEGNIKREVIIKREAIHLGTATSASLKDGLGALQSWGRGGKGGKKTWR
jgi:hypothetical protein